MSSAELIYEDDTWQCVCRPEDGARLSRLCCRGTDLLTGAPEVFEPPPATAGAFETRPVYGYDDCFPSVRPCTHPVTGEAVPDHGECWQQAAETVQADNHLRATFHSHTAPLQLTRTLVFTPDRLRWCFEVRNHGHEPLPFQHVMHPLMPPSLVARMVLPAADRILTAYPPDAKPLVHPGRELLNLAGGEARLVFLQGIRSGRFELHLRGGLHLAVEFPSALFPTLGIWWDRGGYPEPPARGREECAFEPIPGPTGDLAEAVKDGTALVARPEAPFRWEITWKVCRP